MPDFPLPRVAVIGAGISGLTAGKALSDWGIPYTCFESSDEVGGNWYFRNPNGRSSAYRSLHIDTSKPSISFKDFPMPEHYPDYPHHAEIAAWLRDYADAFGLREQIRFRTTVTRAERLPDGGWRIVTDDGAEEPSTRCSSVTATTGIRPTRTSPGPSTARRCTRTTTSTHRSAATSRHRVLVVGIGNSAVDIASELSRKGVAEKVFLSTRSGAWVMPKYIFGRPADQIVKTVPRLPLKLQRLLARPLPRIASGRMEEFGLPTPDHQFLEAHPTVSSELLLRLGSGDAVAKPDVAELLSDRVRFEDGSVEEVDTIVYATGYKIRFPFFDADFISAPGNRSRSTSGCSSRGSTTSRSSASPRRSRRSSRSPSASRKFLARWLGGEWALPPVEDMEREIAADDARFIAHFNNRPRHTMQTDATVYEYELERKVLPAGRERAERGMAVSLAGRARAADVAHASA